MVYSMLWVMQDLYHQPYEGSYKGLRFGAYDHPAIGAVLISQNRFLG